MMPFPAALVAKGPTSAGGGGGSGWHSASLSALAVDNGAWTGFTARSIMPLSVFGGNGSKIRFSIKPGNAEGLIISKCYVGLLSGTEGFASAPVQALFGGSAGFTAAANAAAVQSDDVVLSYTTSDTLVVSVYVPSGNASQDTFRMATAAIGSSGVRYKSGDDAITQSTSGYSSLVSANCFLATLEGFY